MCVDDSVQHGGQSTRDRMRKLKSDYDIEAGPARPQAFAKVSRPNTKAWYKDWRLQAAAIIAVLFGVHWLWTRVTGAGSKSRNGVNFASGKWMNKMGRKLNEGTMTGLEEAIECGREVLVFDQNEKWFYVHDIESGPNGLTLGILVNDVNKKKEIKRVEYFNDMGAKTYLPFDSPEVCCKAGVLKPSLRLLDQNDAQFRRIYGDNEPKHFKGFKNAAKKRHAMRVLVDNLKFNEDSVREAQPEVIFETMGPIVYGYVDLTKRQHNHLRELNVQQLEERIKGIVWEDDFDDMQTDSMITKDGNNFKNNIELELVKNKHMWAKLAVWNTKLRNCVGNQNKDPKEGVDNIRFYNKGDCKHQHINAIYKRIRPDGSFYLVIHVENEDSQRLQDFTKIKWKTGTKGTWNWKSYNDDANISGQCDISENRDVLSNS